MMQQRWFNWFAIALYQIVTLLFIFFEAGPVFHASDRKLKNALIFNTLVLFQAFNYTSSSNSDNSSDAEKEEEEHDHKQNLCVRILTILFVLVLLIVFHEVAGVDRMNWEQWVACVGLAAMSWPVSWISSQNFIITFSSSTPK